MKFSEKEPDQSGPDQSGEPRSFRFFDYIVIYVISETSSTAIISMMTGGSGVWLLLFAYCAWWFHIWNVKNDIAKGIR
jgi:hypothetical protein